ncbi:MAG: TetR/AcrR family transcriptional regulator [Bifidobacteriaceae bacterium]|jgi:AcrR family transcriptional regulator|nr:TetR/AcrR family transcriptional regulator [Bifidobacteriaceae bacterium]
MRIEPEAGGGREAAAKERRRARIVQVATELLDERGGSGFTVDEVAARAEVSRRTVFNYFASVDDLSVAAAAEMLGGLIDSLRLPGAAAGDSDAASQASSADGEGGDPGLLAARAAFSDLTQVLRTVDLVGPMIRLTRAFSPVGPEDPRVATAVQEALFLITGQLSRELRARHPGADPLAVDLLVSMFIGGVVVLYDYWAERSGMVESEASRLIWRDLIDRLVDRIGTGYLATEAVKETPASRAPRSRAGKVAITALAGRSGRSAPTAGAPSARAPIAGAPTAAAPTAANP